MNLNTLAICLFLLKSNAANSERENVSIINGIQVECKIYSKKEEFFGEVINFLDSISKNIVKNSLDKENYKICYDPSRVSSFIEFIKSYNPKNENYNVIDHSILNRCSFFSITNILHANKNVESDFNKAYYEKMNRYILNLIGNCFKEHQTKLGNQATNDVFEQTDEKINSMIVKKNISYYDKNYVYSDFNDSYKFEEGLLNQKYLLHDKNIAHFENSDQLFESTLNSNTKNCSPYPLELANDIIEKTIDFSVSDTFQSICVIEIIEEINKSTCILFYEKNEGSSLIFIKDIYCLNINTFVNFCNKYNIEHNILFKKTVCDEENEIIKLENNMQNQISKSSEHDEISFEYHFNSVIYTFFEYNCKDKVLKAKLLKDKVAEFGEIIRKNWSVIAKIQDYENFTYSEKFESYSNLTIEISNLANDICKIKYDSLKIQSYLLDDKNLEKRNLYLDLFSRRKRKIIQSLKISTKSSIKKLNGKSCYLFKNTFDRLIYYYLRYFDICFYNLMYEILPKKYLNKKSKKKVEFSQNTAIICEKFFEIIESISKNIEWVYNGNVTKLSELKIQG